MGKESTIPNICGIRTDIVHALKKINIPNLRWPGGCFADEYHWKDGIGPREERPTTINSHWGGISENNHFGTHEFFDLCEQLECEPYICGNVGSGTVREMAQWIEYITLKTGSSMADLRIKNDKKEPWKIKYWGIGNENWGCGGNMTAEYYADLFFRYTTYCRNFSGNILYKIACGPVGEFPLEWVLHWTDVIMRKNKFSFSESPIINGLSLHYYTRAGLGASATKFKENKWFLTMERALYMDKLITEIDKIMSNYDPKKKIGLIVDEWGTWWRVEKGTNPGFLYQQNTMRDAIVASLHLDIFNTHCDRVHMANIAQTVNVLQAMILTKEDKMILTPTYHVFDMYKVHQDAILLPMNIESSLYQEKLPTIHGSASVNETNKMHITLSNIDPNNAIENNIEFPDTDIESKKISAKILTAKEMNKYNTFSSPNNLKLEEYDISDIEIEKNHIFLKMPPKSIMLIKLE